MSVTSTGHCETELATPPSAVAGARRRRSAVDLLGWLVLDLVLGLLLGLTVLCGTVQAAEQGGSRPPSAAGDSFIPLRR